MSLNLVSEHLLAANGLSHQNLFSILGQLTERRLDYGDLYFQSSYHESSGFRRQHHQRWLL